MPAADFVAHVLRLPRLKGSALRELLLGDEAEWGPDEENRALLLEIQAYQLDLTWADRTADPDDPEYRKQRAEAMRSGQKPPRHPIVPPIALRPSAVAERRMQEHVDALTAAYTTRRVVTLAEFDRVVDQM